MLKLKLMFATKRAEDMIDFLAERFLSVDSQINLIRIQLKDLRAQHGFGSLTHQEMEEKIRPIKDELIGLYEQYLVSAGAGSISIAYNFDPVIHPLSDAMMLAYLLPPVNQDYEHPMVQDLVRLIEERQKYLEHKTGENDQTGKSRTGNSGSAGEV